MPAQAELPKAPLGKTGLEAPPLCVGCAALGNMPEVFGFEVSEEQALETLRAVFAGPIPFADTAAAYGDGESERRIGIVLKEIGGLPPGFLLSTKADRDMRTGDFSSDQMKRSVERSLNLLGLDRVELLFLHDPEHAGFKEMMARKGPVETLLDFCDQGVIGSLGVAGGPIGLMIEYVKTGAFEAVLTHNRYTLLNRSAEPLLDAASELGLGVLNAAPYGSGLLAKGPGSYPRYAYQPAPSETLERAAKAAEICRSYDVPLAGAALQFSMRDRRIHSTVVGVTKPERIRQTVELARHPIPSDLWEELKPLASRDADPEADRF